MPVSELGTFLRYMHRIDGTRTRLEQLYADNSIRKTDLESVYEALFLRTVTGFENYLEQLFISILLGKAVYSQRRVGVLMNANSKRALMGILMQDNDYLSWLPYRKTVDRANIYLRGGKPFSELNNGDRSQIAEITFIRNAIAHKSDYAMKVFREKAIGSQPLLRNEKTPAGFLRSQFRANPRQIRFEVYLSELGRIASALS